MEILLRNRKSKENIFYLYYFCRQAILGFVPLNSNPQVRLKWCKSPSWEFGEVRTLGLFGSSAFSSGTLCDWVYTRGAVPPARLHSRDSIITRDLKQHLLPVLREFFPTCTQFQVIFVVTLKIPLRLLNLTVIQQWKVFQKKLHYPILLLAPSDAVKASVKQTSVKPKA